MSEVCEGHLGVERRGAHPIMHDTPAGELAQPYGVRDWKKGESTDPWQTAADHRGRARLPRTYKRFTAWALMDKVGNGGKGHRLEHADRGRAAGRP